MNSTEKDQSPMLSFLNILFRRGWYIIICLVAVLGPIAYYNRTAAPVYEAVTTIIYESPPVAVTSSVPYDYRIKEPLLNHIQEIKSRSVAMEVVNALPQWVLDKIPVPRDVGQDFNYKSFYAAKIRSSIDAAPVAESDIIQVKVHANDAYAAMTIANTLTDVLAKRNLRIKQKEVSGVRSFIEEQWAKYAQKLQEAEQALRNYKQRNRVVSLDKEVEEVLRRITQIDAIYQETKANRDKIEERLKAVNEKIKAHQSNIVPSITDVSTPLVQQLKEDYKELQTQYIRQQLQGVPLNNSKMVQMRAEMADIRKRLTDEAVKIAKADNVIDPLSQITTLYEEKFALELDLETYRTQERSLANSVAEYEAKLRQLPGKEYELARLTRDRDLANNIFLMLSQRREEARITEAEKIGNLRVIDKAELPKTPISPKKRLNLAIGLILGLTMGIGLAFFLESLDTSIKTPEEVEKKTGLTIVGSIPRIYVSSKKDTRSDEAGAYKKLSPRLITYSMSNSPAAEAYRTLRTNLQFADMRENLRTFMFTSSGPREGKSTTVANLAVTTAQMGLRTLIVDADLRRPTIHKFFGLHRKPGLADILTYFFDVEQQQISKIHKDYYKDEADDADAINEELMGTQNPMGEASIKAKKTVQQIASLDLAITEAIHPTNIKGLDVLTCGELPTNPSEVLASETMKDLLSLVKEKYEFVAIDAPPIIAVTDAAVLAPNIDGVLLVIESGRNDKEIIQKATSLLDRVGVNIIGAILNNVREKNLYGDYDYYYTYYSNTSAEKKGKKGKKRK